MQLRTRYYQRYLSMYCMVSSVHVDCHALLRVRKLLSFLSVVVGIFGCPVCIWWIKSWYENMDSCAG
ncbi:uncharacterized protein BT62DRAFT_931537 [Guyanagaster necrorhizus]|uniref:Uncharacterized protein n=1 Tax=Guyanagaster necrorhizus TaxID=856835 RepID=A0A9P7VUP7_9AGAR|nr:uncharacterized protein BT62DRAFT_931537 [Guyanagaster necrorhizus MCA 3950]KAG7446963.1 hypothetical protein BT62DRAFT_931537 [Guyanagaster necrorhizus MCA 3950]